MKMLIFLFFMLISGTSNFTGNIAEFNKAKSEAEFAYNDEKYDLAVEKYHYLIDSLKYENDDAKLNLAHSYYKKGEIEQSKAIYSGLQNSSDKEVRSIANQQLGVFESRGENLQKSLDYFKNSLRANPNNEESRYNYELVKKKLDEQKDQNKDQENKDEENKDQENKDQEKKDQENKDQKNQDQKDQEQKDQDKKDQEKKEQEEKDKEEKDKKGDKGEKDEKDEKEKKEQNPEKSDEEKEEEMKEEKPQPSATEPNFDDKEISKEMAEMILQAMRNKELQYLQQLKKQPQKPKDKDKPDW